MRVTHIINYLAGIILILLWAGLNSAFAGSGKVDLKFSGNRHIGVSDLKKLWQFQSDSVTAEILADYSHAILRLYQQKGYYFARIDSFKESVSGNRRTLRFFITEDSPVRIGKIQISGSRAIRLRDILNEMNTRPGRIFRPGQLKEDLSNLVRLYADRGYPLCEIRLETLQIKPVKNAVEIRLKIREGPPGKIATIEIPGNDVAKKRTILRELRLYTGKPFRKKDLDQIQQRLRKLPYLQLAGEPVITWDSTGAGHLKIPVRKGNMAQFDGTLGYNPPTVFKKGYFTGLIDVNFQNLFGTGRAFSAFWQRKNVRSQEIKLYYKEPWVLNRPVDLDVSFQQRLQDTTFVRRVWEIGSQINWLESFRFHFKIGRESILPDSIGEVLFQIRKSQAWRASGGFSYDSRDDRLNPRHGVFYGTGVDFLRRKTFGRGGGTQDIRRTAIDFEGYWNWFGRQVWAIGLHGKEVRFPGGDVPVEEQFYLGGSRTLRGYREDQFRGSRIAWSNLEYRYIMGRRSRLFVFLDTGWISNREKTPHAWRNLFKFGYGFGIRTQTALGIVGLDYGLGEGDTFARGKIHLRIINQF